MKARELVSVKKFVTALFAVTLITSIALSPSFKMRPKYFMNKDFTDACGWIIKNTPIDALFMTEPFFKNGERLRLSCFRSNFINYKDGARSLFSRDYAIRWFDRVGTAFSFHKDYTGRKATPEDLMNFIRHYKVTHIFSNYSLNIGLEPAYQNDSFYIYQTKDKIKP